MSKFNALIVFVCALFLIGCTSAPDSNANANSNVNSENEANLGVYKMPEKEVPKTNSNIEEPKKPEVVYPPSTAKLELSGTNETNIYNVVYTPKQSKKPSTEISIITTESELIGIEIRYRDSKTMVRLLNKGKFTGYDSGKKFVKNGDVVISKCFAGARKLVGKYETALKVSESAMHNLLINDCPEFPKAWMIPLSEESYKGN